MWQYRLLFVVLRNLTINYPIYSDIAFFFSCPCFSLSLSPFNLWVPAGRHLLHLHSKQVQMISLSQDKTEVTKRVKILEQCLCCPWCLDKSHASSYSTLLLSLMRAQGCSLFLISFRSSHQCRDKSCTSCYTALFYQVWGEPLLWRDSSGETDKLVLFRLCLQDILCLALPLSEKDP